MEKCSRPNTSNVYYPSEINVKTPAKSEFYETVNKNMRKIENRLTVPSKTLQKRPDKYQTQLTRKQSVLSNSKIEPSENLGRHHQCRNAHCNENRNKSDYRHAVPIKYNSCQENCNKICGPSLDTNVPNDKYTSHDQHMLRSLSCHGVQSSERYCFVTDTEGSRKLQKILILSNYSKLPDWKHDEILKASSKDLWRVFVDKKQTNPTHESPIQNSVNTHRVNQKMIRFSQDPVIQKVVIKQPVNRTTPINTLSPTAGKAQSQKRWSKNKLHSPFNKEKKSSAKKIADQQSVTTSTMTNLLCMNCFDPGNGEDDLSTIESDSGSDGGEGSDDGGAGDHDDLDEIDGISDIDDIEFSSGGGDDDDGSDVSDGSSMHQDDLIHDEEMNIAMHGEFGDQEEIGETDYTNQMMFDEMNSIDEDERRGRYYYQDREDPFFDPIDNEMKYNDIFLPSSGNSGEEY